MDSESTNLILILVLGTAGMLILAGGIIFFVVYYQKKMLQNKIHTQQLEAEYQKELLKSTLESQEKERRRIATELHDGVGAMLSATKLCINMMKNGTIPMEELDLAMVDAKEMLDDTIETVRRISKDLLPASLEIFGLSKALSELCEKLSTRETPINFYEIGEKVKLNAEDELLLYRIIQELINNALKHAQASSVKVSINWNYPIEVVVSDDGKGFDLLKTKEDVKRGIGLYNIENRVSLLNGEVKFDSAVDEGTRISIVIGG